MMTRLLQLMLIIIAALLGYQLPSLDISFPMALFGLICYGLFSWRILTWADHHNRV
jgi:hypothetical protein